MSADELKESFSALDRDDGFVPPDYTWERHAYEIRQHVFRDDPEHFLRWSTISATMFVGTAPYVKAEVELLRGAPDGERWQSAVEEPWFGDPPPLLFYPRSSGNLVHQAYHLKNWQDVTGLEIRDLESVYEFGGGYGAMALLARRLGFKGRYVIQDLPEVSLLQQYWLSNVGIWDVECVTQAPDQIKADLIVACFSVSEFQPEYRMPFEAAQARSYLIAYQDRFGGVDNASYFQDFERSRTETAWFGWEMGHLGGRHYLFGIRE